MWVAADGSYGSCEIATFDVSSWTADEIEQIEEASDGERLALAKSISARYR
jgi:hypothetical protein